MSAELIVIVPTRSRPQSVAPVVEAWRDTDAFADGGRLVFVLDADDPTFGDYAIALSAASPLPGSGQPVSWIAQQRWRPLVPKLNSAADYLHVTQRPYALGFAGDDHRPRTAGWARRYLDELRSGAGIVHGDDGYQGVNLPTEWAMRADIVSALGGRMVPAPVEHLYCDNSVQDLGRATGLLRYLPDVRIEHLHPAAGHPGDEQHERVNSREQYRTDRPAYRAWRRSGLFADVEAVNRFIKGETS